MNHHDQGIVKEISEFVQNVHSEHLSSEITGVAKRCIIDVVGVILAGTEEPCVRIVRDWVLSQEGRRESSLLGRREIRVPAPYAALVNGTAGHAMDWDDTALSTTPDRALLLHPTLPPLAAAMSVAESQKLSGGEFLAAFIAGFEVECKIAESISPDHWARGFHSSKTCGIFGATVAAAKLLRLTSSQTRNAIGIAASMAAGVVVNFGTMVKPLHVGQAAEGGIVAVQLAGRGFEAHPEALGENKGFFHAFGGGFDPEKIRGRLGNPFSLLDPGVSIKPYPCGVVGHPGMDAMLSLVEEHDIRPEGVARVRISTGSNILGPKGPLHYVKAQTGLQGKFCLPFQMASMILHRKAGVKEFTDEFVQSAAVQEMMDKVEAVVDPKIEALGKDKIFSVIEIHLKDGTVVKGESSKHYRGGPQDPLSRIDLEKKFLDATQMILAPDPAKRLFEKIEALEEVDSLEKMIQLAVV
jgi:2-methylcitrate dehydratase PrpD